MLKVVIPVLQGEPEVLLRQRACLAASCGTSVYGEGFNQGYV